MRNKIVLSLAFAGDTRRDFPGEPFHLFLTLTLLCSVLVSKSNTAMFRHMVPCPGNVWVGAEEERGESFLMLTSEAFRNLVGLAPQKAWTPMEYHSMIP